MASTDEETAKLNEQLLILSREIDALKASIKLFGDDEIVIKELRRIHTAVLTLAQQLHVKL